MKKLFYWILVSVLSFILIGVSLGQKPVQKVPDFVDDQIFPKDIPYSLVGGKLVDMQESTKVQANRLNDGDAIFYLDDSETPKVRISNDSEDISLGKWLYLISAFDAYRNYAVKHESFSVDHLSNGVYFIDTRKDIRIFSMSALLRVQLLDRDDVLTKLEIFPSEYFAYDPAMGSKLVQSDVFRIGQLATLTIADPFSETGFASIFWEDADSSRILFEEYRKYYRNRQVEIRKILAKFNPAESKGLTKLDTFSMFFVNGQKKRAILESSLISLLQTMILLETDACDFCKEKSLDSPNVSKRISERIKWLEDIGPSEWDNARKLVRKYITLWNSINAAHTSEYYGIGGSTVTSVYQAAYPGSQLKEKKAYKLLSDIYAQYFFWKSDSDQLQRNLASYIKFLLNSKSMGEREFLGFTYYLKEFLNNEGTSSDSNFGLFTQLTSISDDYIQSLSGNVEKFNMLSIFYFSFNSISERMASGIEYRFFDGTSDDLRLKPAFLTAKNKANIPSDSINALNYLVDKQSYFLNKYKELYLAELGKSDDNSVNGFTQFANSNQKLNELLGILKDYENYRIQKELSDKSKWATGLDRPDNELTLEDLAAYLKEFSGVEIETLKVDNDFKKDGFYRVSVNILSRPFSFKLLPKWHEIQEIVFRDENGVENTKNKKASVSLDLRKKELADSPMSSDTPEERAKRDIRNYFKLNFFEKEETVASTGAVVAETVVLSPKMQLFVQRELIEGDFSIVSGVFSIGMKNVKADIVDGDYLISISNVPVNVLAKGQNVLLNLSADYVFQKEVHAFRNIRFTATDSNKRESFEGNVVRIVPFQINTIDLENQFKKVGPLLDIVNKHYVKGDTDIRLDLDANSVIIWGVIFTE